MILMRSKLGLHLLIVIFLLPSQVMAQAPDYPRRLAAHSQGNIQSTIEPDGWGQIYLVGGEYAPFPDPVTKDSVWGCEYPRASRNRYLAGSMFVGAVVGSDTLVTSLWGSPTFDYYSLWSFRSADTRNAHYSPEAYSDLDLETGFSDTAAWFFGYDTYFPSWEGGWHYPLGLVVTQRSMAWSGALIDDFILMEFELVNMGDNALETAYIGFSLWNYRISRVEDHLTGFLRDFTLDDQCGYTDRLNIAYSMDNDGDPVRGGFPSNARKAAVGVTLLGSSQDSLQIGYTWNSWDDSWRNDWGPRRQPSIEEPWRNFNPYFSWPGTDRNLYHTLRHPSIAYDQIMAAIDHTGEGWMPPGPRAETVALGLPTHIYYWFGPFNIGVRERASFTIAVVGGDNVHTDPWTDFDPYHPQQFYDQLDFSELAENARWAQWVYDNPGYDTDSDGYAGEFRICNGDTVWYKGDGVPDFRGNTPPPAPFTRFITEPGLIKIRWNGFLTETFKDPFSGLVDFEGYRVYAGLDTRRSSLSVLASYDKENFFRLKYHDLGSGNGKWLNDEPPYTLAELRTIHNDSTFDPHRYTRSYPLFESDSTFYFRMVDANLNDLSSIHGIHKVYPDATNPGPDSTLWTEDDVTYDYTGRMLPKFYEYEFIHDNLLPTVPYFVAVTSFDFGYAGGRGNLPPDESNPLNNLTEVYAQTSADSVEAHDLDVYVYPNPYRVDADYHSRGYENRGSSIIPDRARLLHFANLPNVCKISIFSLDGDLIGEINHDFPDGGPEAMHDWWNLVSRSGLAVESGLYFYTVESATRTQIGKFAIIK